MTSRLTVVTALVLVPPLLALDGQPGIHDPSTIVVHKGKCRTECQHAAGLSAVGSSKPTLATFRPDGDRERWHFKKP